VRGRSGIRVACWVNTNRTPIGLWLDRPAEIGRVLINSVAARGVFKISAQSSRSLPGYFALCCVLRCAPQRNFRHVQVFGLRWAERECLMFYQWARKDLQHGDLSALQELSHDDRWNDPNLGCGTDN
jgi:hypothetical protein